MTDLHDKEKGRKKVSIQIEVEVPQNTKKVYFHVEAKAVIKQKSLPYDKIITIPVTPILKYL